MRRLHLVVIAIFAILFLIGFTHIPPAAAEGAEATTFRVTAWSGAEKFFLAEDQDCGIDQTNPGIGIGRAIYPGGHFTYSIPTAGMTRCTLNLAMGNRYRVSASRDGVNWQEMAVAKDVVGPRFSNYGLYPVDISKLLPADKVYIKFENSQTEGFGCFLHSMTVLSDRPKPQTSARLDVQSGQLLTMGLPCIHGNGWTPRDKTTAQISLVNGLLHVRAICQYPAGYKPVSFIKTRDGYVYRDDCIEIFLADASTPSEYRHFAINSANTQFDELGKDSAVNWDWKSKATMTKNAWIADFTIDPAKVGLHLTSDSTLLLCLSRVDGATGEIYVSTPISDGLHQPSKWMRLSLGAGSQSIPTIGYDIATESFVCSGKTAQKIQFIVQDDQANAVFADTIPAGGNHSRRFTFAKPGVYSIYACMEDGLAAIFPIRCKAVEKFEANVVSPVIYTGEIAKIAYTKRQGDNSKPNITLTSQGKQVKAHIESKKNLFLIPGLPVGEYEAQVGTKGSAPIRMKFFVRQSTSTSSKVEITQSGYIRVNGKPFIPVVIFLPEDMADCAAHGFNVGVQGYDYDWLKIKPEWLDTNRKMLDDAQSHGIKIMLHLCNLIRYDEADYDNLRLMVSTFKEHPAIFGWYIADEPSANVFGVDKLANAYAAIKAIDTDHPVIILDSTPLLYKLYAPYCDILACDPYPVPYAPLSEVADWTQIALDASKNKCVMTALQGLGTPTQRYPTVAEQETMMDYAFSKGAKMVGWWAHYTMKESGYWDSYKDLTSKAASHIRKMYK